MRTGNPRGIHRRSGHRQPRPRRATTASRRAGCPAVSAERLCQPVRPPCERPDPGLDRHGEPGRTGHRVGALLGLRRRLPQRRPVAVHRRPLQQRHAHRRKGGGLPQRRQRLRQWAPRPDRRRPRPLPASFHRQRTRAGRGHRGRLLLRRSADHRQAGGPVPHDRPEPGGRHLHHHVRQLPR